MCVFSCVFQFHSKHITEQGKSNVTQVLYCPELTAISPMLQLMFRITRCASRDQCHENLPTVASHATHLILDIPDCDSQFLYALKHYFREASSSAQQSMHQ